MAVAPSRQLSPLSISIAMCTYNGAQYLREQLESISDQGRLPDDMVICDDRSDDGTTHIIEKFAAAAPFPVRVFHNDGRLGSTKNFERAISLCTADIIALCDQDDVWRPDKLAQMEAAFRAEPQTGLVFSDAEVVDEQLHPLGYRLWERSKLDATKQRLLREGQAFELLLDSNFVTGATMAFRSTFKELVLPIPRLPVAPKIPVLIHDGWIALLIAAVARFCPLADPLVKYRQHPKQQVGFRPAADLIDPAAPAEDAQWRSTMQRTSIDLRRLRQLLVLRERLSAMSTHFHYTEPVARFMEKAAHWHVRASIPERRLHRVPSVLKELLSCRYHRYSNGLRSAAKDLWF